VMASLLLLVASSSSVVLRARGASCISPSRIGGGLFFGGECPHRHGRRRIHAPSERIRRIVGTNHPPSNTKSRISPTKLRPSPAVRT
jgi:hypothetical protein